MALINQLNSLFSHAHFDVLVWVTICSVYYIHHNFLFAVQSLQCQAFLESASYNSSRMMVIQAPILTVPYTEKCTNAQSQDHGLQVQVCHAIKCIRKNAKTNHIGRCPLWLMCHQQLQDQQTHFWHQGTSLIFSISVLVQILINHYWWKLFPSFPCHVSITPLITNIMLHLSANKTWKKTLAGTSSFGGYIVAQYWFLIA